MIYKTIPINQAVYSNIDNISSGQMTPDRINTYRNAAGATVRRPGYFDYIDVGTRAPIDGLFQWNELLIIISDGNVYQKIINQPLTLLGTGLFNKDTRVTWANFGNVLYAANGGNIVKITSTIATLLTDLSIPPNVSHVIAFDTYMLVNSVGTAQVYYSKVGEPENFTGGGFFSAEQSPDNVVALHSSWDKIWVFGERTVELFQNDGRSPFVPIGGSTLSIGCSAPYSIQLIRDAFYWLNDLHQVVRSSGNAYEIISDPVGNFLTEHYQENNSIGDYIFLDEKHFFILTNPNYRDSGLTLVYDIVLNEWQGKWGYWTGQYNRFRGQSYVNSNTEYLIGDQDNGKIYIFGNTYKDDGNLQRASWLTGWMDYETLERKRSLRLRFRVLRGESLDNDPNRLMIRWRDDGSRTWGNTHYLDLGAKGDYPYYVLLNRLGHYRMRQYELSITDNVAFIIASCEEAIS